MKALEEAYREYAEEEREYLLVVRNDNCHWSMLCGAQVRLKKKMDSLVRAVRELLESQVCEEDDGK